MRNIPAAQARRFDRFRCFSRRGLFNIHHIAVMAVCAGTEPRPINIAPIAKIMLRFIAGACPIADLVPFKTGRAQNELLPEHVDNIHRWYEGYQDVEGICRVVTLDEIRENDFNLNIPRYVEPVIEEESITIDQAIANLKESLQAAYAAEDRLKSLLLREGLL